MRSLRVIFSLALVLSIVLAPGYGAAASPQPVLSEPGSAVQTFDLGGQRITYTGAAPLKIESGVYWDTPPSTAQTALVVDSRGEHLLAWPGAGDQVRLIVQFEAGPLATAAPADRRERYPSLQAEHTAVRASLQAQGLVSEIRHEFFTTYSGLAVTARAGAAARIAQTPGVRAVYPDYQVEALLEQSVPLIGAPPVWSLTDAGGKAVTGQGVSVAVIDSGVDYNHPDLGGPGFPNARVTGGYNFIADNGDPWDDFGHGTHISGIIGAQGAITGVAPGANLVAYKIFDSQGKGVTSDILAALERALDPDGNPETDDDGAAVINLSLGDAGTPDDPLSQACDNAVRAGAVVSIAAGNSGSRYGSLLSPGMAPLPISVGATDKSDKLWTGSSRGPVPATWAIKPDLVAPGVSIHGPLPGGKYEYGSGTSGSAAHISGAAALLRQLHPTWGPEWIKAALMNTAKDLGLSPFEQGAGRVQVDQAALTPTLILPASLSLGRVDPGQPTWSRTETLTFSNTGAAPQTYTLSTSGTFPAGVSLTLDPTQVTVPPGGAATASFTVSIDTALTPDAANDPFAYWGAVRAAPESAGVPALRVPFAFFKAALLRVHTDEAKLSGMILHTNPLLSRYVLPATANSDYLLPSGAYDVIFQYRQPYAYVLGQVNLPASGFAELNLPRSAAIYPARIAFNGESGQTLAPNTGLHRLMRSGNGWLVNESSASGPISETVYFSELPPDYLWERSLADAGLGSAAYREWHGRAVGVNAPLEFLSTPQDFVHVSYPLQGLPGGALSLYEIFTTMLATSSYTVGPNPSELSAPSTRQAYYRSPPSGHSIYSQRYLFPNPLPTNQAGALMSPWLQLDESGRLAWSLPSAPGNAYYRTAASIEPWRLGPPHFFARFAADRSTRIRLAPSAGSRLYFRAYQGGDLSLEKNQPYELRQGETLVASGDLGSALGMSQALINLPSAGVYSLTLPFSYTLKADGSLSGQGRAVASFDTRRYPADIDPPYLSVLRLLRAGLPGDHFMGPVTLHLVVTDMVDPAPAVQVACNTGAGWLEVSVVQSGGEYLATLPDFPSGANVALRVTTADASGNSLTHFLEPAYRVQRFETYLPGVKR